MPRRLDGEAVPCRTEAGPSKRMLVPHPQGAAGMNPLMDI